MTYDKYIYRWIAYVQADGGVRRSHRKRGDKRSFSHVLRGCPNHGRAAVCSRWSFNGPKEIIAMRVDLPYTCHEVYETVEAAIAAAVLGAPLGAREGD